MNTTPHPPATHRTYEGTPYRPPSGSIKTHEACALPVAAETLELHDVLDELVSLPDRHPGGRESDDVLFEDAADAADEVVTDPGPTVLLGLFVDAATPRR
jgi:hypothetical protein